MQLRRSSSASSTGGILHSPDTSSPAAEDTVKNSKDQTSFFKEEVCCWCMCLQNLL